MRVFRSAVDFSATNRFSRPISGTFIIACSVSVSIPAGDHHPLCGMRRRRHSILLQISLSNHIGGVIILLFCALAFFAIKRLGYIEFITARKGPAHWRSAAVGSPRDLSASMESKTCFESLRRRV
jgi:hypothetical protein